MNKCWDYSSLLTFVFLPCRYIGKDNPTRAREARAPTSALPSHASRAQRGPRT